MARYLNDGSFEKQLKESTLEHLYALWDFCVMTVSYDKLEKVKEEIKLRQEQNK